MLILQWKSFDIRLKRMEKYLASSNPNFDGLVADESELKVMFKSAPLQVELDQVQTYWDSLQESVESLDNSEEQQIKQRAFGIRLSGKLVDMVGAINLDLTKAGTPPNVAAVLSNLQAIKALLDTGALKTARGLCASVKSQYPDYISVFDYCINLVTQFLIENNYE